MKDSFESFRKFLNEEERPDFRFTALLVNKRSKERGKKDILNDIRAFRGVTVVAVRDAEKGVDTRKNDYSELSIKVDRFPLGHASVKTILTHLESQISHLDGVVVFRVKGIPETI